MASDYASPAVRLYGDGKYVRLSDYRQACDEIVAGQAREAALRKVVEAADGLADYVRATAGQWPPSLAAYEAARRELP